MDQVTQNLPFEVVAVPQNVVHTNTTLTMPIKVKIKMKKEDKGIPRQRVISVPKLKPRNPEISRKVKSDETIMSFNIHLESEGESKPRRKSQNKFFHLFKTGKCIDTQDDDENDPPYMLATPVKSREIKSQRLLLAEQDKKQKYNIKTTDDVPKPPDIIFGKCKPGGCLDPPFGEDKYTYYPTIQLKQELKDERKVLTENKEEIKISKTNVKASDYHESDASSTHMLYKADPKNDISSDKYSDSIITYPTRTSSRDLSILEKSVISNKSSSIKTKHLNVDTYFTPPKKSKSQDRKRELTSNNIADLNRSQNESNLAFRNTPKSKQNRELQAENTQINTDEFITQPNNKLSHIVEVSEKILSTVHQIKGPVGSYKSKPDEIRIKSDIQEVIVPLDDYKNIAENQIHKKDIIDDKVVSSIEINSSPLKNSEIPPKLNAMQKTNIDSIKTNDKVVFINDKDQEVQSSILNICSDLDMEQTKGSIQEKIKNELPKHAVYTEEVKPQLLDLTYLTETLPNIDNNAGTDRHSQTQERIPSTKNSNEQLSAHLPRFNNMEFSKIKDDNLVIHENLNITPNILLGPANASIYSNDSKVYSNNEIAKNSAPKKDIEKLTDITRQNNEYKYTKEEIPNSADLNSLTKTLPNVDNNVDFVPSIKKSNEQLGDRLAKLNHLDFPKSKDDNLAIHEDLNIPPNILLEQVNASIYSNDSKAYSNNKIAKNSTPIKGIEKLSDGTSQNYEYEYTKEEIPKSLDIHFRTTTLPNVENNAEFVPSTKKSNEQLNACLTKSNHLDFPIIKDDNLHEDLNVIPNILLESKAYSNNEIVKNLAPKKDIEKLNDITRQNNEYKFTKEEKPQSFDINFLSKTLLNVDNNADYVPSANKSNEELSARLVPSNNLDFHFPKIKGNNLGTYEDLNVTPNILREQVNASIYSNDSKVYSNKTLTRRYSSSKNNTDKFSDTISQNSNVIEVDNDVKMFQQPKKVTNPDKPIDRQNITQDDNAYSSIPFNTVVTLSDLLPETLNNQVITTTEKYFYNNISENIKTNDNVEENDLIDNTERQNLSKQNKDTERDNEQPLINLVSQHADHMKTSSSTVSWAKKATDISINKDEGKSSEVSKRYPDYNHANFSQQAFTENILPDLEFRTLKPIGEDIVSNDSSSIVPANYLKNETPVVIPNNNISKQYLTIPSGNSNVKSIRPFQSAVISTKANNNNIDSHLSSKVNLSIKEEIPQTSYINTDSMEKTDKGKTSKKLKRKLSSRTTNSITVDFGFQTYLNENGEMIFKSFDASQLPQRVSQDRIFVKRSVIKLNDSELSFVINSDTRLSLKINKNTDASDERSFKLEETSRDTTQRIYSNRKYFNDTSDIEILQESLSAVYENDLIPIEQLIRSLRIEVDRIAQYGRLMQKQSISATKKMKPAYPKRCVCTRKWNNHS